MKREIFIFKHINEMSDCVVSIWGKIAQKAIRERGFFTVALSGGKTPIPFYHKLTNPIYNFQWEKTFIFLVDERFVSHNHLDSNFAMIRDALLNKVSLPEGNIKPIPVEETPEVSASKYEVDLRRFFNIKGKGYPSFDLIILGVGLDGHTASLFPGDPRITENDRLVISISNPSVNHERITITLPVINNARNIMFLATGDDKARIIKEVIENKNNELPVSLAFPEHGKVFLLLDIRAASHLSKLLH